MNSNAKGTSANTHGATERARTSNTDRLVVVEIGEGETVRVVTDTENANDANLALLKTRRGAMFRGTELVKTRKGLSPADLATLKSFVLRRLAAERGSTPAPMNRAKDRRAQQEQRAPRAGLRQHAHASALRAAADLLSTVGPAVACAVTAERADVALPADEPLLRGTRRTQPFVFDFAAAPHRVMKHLGVEGTFGAYVKLHRKEFVQVGERHDVEILRACCPFHEPSGALSLMIVPSLGRFACEVCIHDGDVIDFVVAMERCSREYAETLLWDLDLALKRSVVEARSARRADAPSATPVPAPAIAPREVPWASYSLHCPLVVDAEGVRLVAYLPEELHQLLAVARRVGGVQALIERADAPSQALEIPAETLRAAAACDALGGVEMCQRLVEAARPMGGVEKLLDTVAMLRSLMARAS